MICFSFVLHAVDRGARILPESETRHPSYSSLVPIDPHVLLHRYRWLSWCAPRYLDQTPPLQSRRPFLSFLFLVPVIQSRIGETMQSILSATQPENACSGRYVDPSVPWSPSPRPQPYSEFNPYEDGSNNAVDHQHRPDGPVIPISWGLEVYLASDDGSETAASMRGARFAHNAKVPCDPFNRKRKRWSLLKKLRRYLGTTAFPA